MEVVEIPRISGNGGKAEMQCNADEEEERELKIRRAARVIDLDGGVGRFYGWPSSRIVRVSRASGGKDRHSKVLTVKGLRDRRVRLSVNTAIQFYDLQDRLGYDQPSKAVEWLLKAAASSIQELPPINKLFPDSPKQLSDEKNSSTGGVDNLGFDSAEMDMNGGDQKYHHHQQKAFKCSACSSPSEASEASGLSLSRSESRTKAWNRAGKRKSAEEKDKENASHASLGTISHTTSFTELLSGGGRGAANESHFFQKSLRQWSSAPMDYFTSAVLGPPATPVASPLFSLEADHHQEPQRFSFVPDHLVSAVNAATAAGENNDDNNSRQNGSNAYNLNFTTSSSANSSGLSGFNRGTLQSNSSSPSLLPQLQRFPLIDGPPSFFIGTAVPVENHHQFLSGFDAHARLQLYYGDAHGNDNGRQTDQKGREKN